MASAEVTAQQQDPKPTRSNDDSSSDDASSGGSSPEPSVVNADAPTKAPIDWFGMEQDPIKKKSLKDRSKIPNSFYVTLLSLALLQGSSGMYSVATLTSWWTSIVTQTGTIRSYLEHYNQLGWSLLKDGGASSSEYLQAALTLILAVPVLYIFIGAPLLAGLWTSPSRATKHVMHRYMGLSFLIQYGLAWMEFLTDYEGAGQASYLPHFVALNGLVQAWSAFFTFRVLPESLDAGYYSDKAVMSRNFVHENAFFSLYSVFGSVYYHPVHGPALRESLLGRLVLICFLFYPYVAIRPFFPITRFNNAGSSHNSRSEQNKRFYEIGTTAVKIFYLWAKYFLGFYINLLIFSSNDAVSDQDWKFIRGMFLFNAGTVSLAMFLHTLRFKKVLGPKFAFSIYLVQIYATFSAIPLAWNLLTCAPKLSALVTVGLLVNLTRDRLLHAVWCTAALLLITCTTEIN